MCEELPAHDGMLRDSGVLLRFVCVMVYVSRRSKKSSAWSASDYFGREERKRRPQVSRPCSCEFNNEITNLLSID